MTNPIRRRVLRVSVGAVVAATAAQRAVALPEGAARDPTKPAGAPSDTAGEIARLAFLNTHTGESLDVVYREGSHYLSDALADIDHLLRDHRTGDVRAIDPTLLEQLTRLAASLGIGARAFHVISGYRSARTNAMLAARSSGVARHSLHIAGRAIDIRLPGVPLPMVHRAALAMQAGGVGYYRRSDFVHLDTGRVRSWG